jgi:type I restriction enzyme S subunit
MNRYSSYKDSGVEWVGACPSHWKRTKLKHYTNYLNGYAFKSDGYVDDGIPVIRIGDVKPVMDLSTSKKVPYGLLEELSTYEIKYGDILIALTGATIGKSATYIENIPSLLNQRVGLVRNSVGLERVMIKYYFSLHQFREYVRLECDGGAQENIGTSELGEFPVVLPPLTEQQQIVAFLDHKTEKIDNLISHKQKKINLLIEKRTALINHVVTKGLNPDVELKDSGVEWIGEIPRHWKFTPLKRLVKIGNGRDYKHIVLEEGGYPVYGTGGEFSRCSEYLHTGPSVLLGRKGTINNPLLVNEPFWTSDTIYYTIINQEKVKPKLLFNLVHQIPFGFFSYGSAIPSMTKTDYEEMRFPLPDLEEQQQILNYLDNQTKEIDDLIQLEQQKIELLKEYRQSLISEVVTGKVRVCEEDLSESEVMTS